MRLKLLSCIKFCKSFGNSSTHFLGESNFPEM
ncbi:hypothetical protein NC653_007280 [Populus alba x Populus x berolinensis]|uniref:Uncharacterized protein n=1 Tax=Populus alba x Populus x berolinensis TaxID=444605 RepID=A0AAD6RGH8_9ROSI|nr:hypothetical protein NC653_007280 [Populus alba x Populus x berolinensis]